MLKFKIQLGPEGVALFKLTTMFDSVHCARTLAVNPITATTNKESKIFFMLKVLIINKSLFSWLQETGQAGYSTDGFNADDICLKKT